MLMIRNSKLSVDTVNALTFKSTFMAENGNTESRKECVPVSALYTVVKALEVDDTVYMVRLIANLKSLSSSVEKKAFCGSTAFTLE